MDTYMAKILYCGVGACVSFGGSTCYSDLCDKIRTRLPQLDQNAFSLKYTVHPDTTIFDLDSEVDMRMLYRVLDQYKADFIDIHVHASNRSSGANVENDQMSPRSVDDGGFLEANEFLGCFRREDAKIYISNSWKHILSYKGQIFEGGVKEFRLKLRMYAIAVGFEYTLATNKANRVVAFCKKKTTDGCNWRVRASLLSHNGFFYIYDLVNDHNCGSVVRLRSSKMVNSQLVKEVVLDKVRDNPNSKAIEIQQDLKLNYGLDIPYHKAWYGKELARETVLGVEAVSYSQLKWWGERTTEPNPGSRVDVQCDTLSEGPPKKYRFKRMFVTYGALLNGFQFCRPVLHIDATFITNKYRGMLLAATAKDANCGLYPVAYAIVDSETEDNWDYFLTHLSDCLSKLSARPITFISDRNIGLLNAVRRVFPDSHLGFCYRHLKANLSNKFAAGTYLSKRIPTLFMRCAYSRTPEHFEINLQKLKHEGGAVVENFLKDLPKSTWASCHFNGERYGEMTNNLAECFNSWVKDLKGLPIVDFNNAVRVRIMALIAARKIQGAGWVSVLCPNLEKKLAANLDLGRHWVVTASNTYAYEIQTQKHIVSVNLESLSCSCGEWQVHGFPCSHALLAAQNHSSDIYSFVDSIFKVDKYQNTYSFVINPISTISKPTQK